jgi:DNA-binding NarL/FixJ family response regulator
VFTVPKCILIVDDSLVIRKILRETLGREAGWEVCEASNGREGIAKAQQLKPDLVVLDLSMAVMNGLNAARELTRLVPGVPLVMFTNFETAHLKREALSSGTRAIVSKDGPIGTLVSSIQALLEPVS